MDLPKYHKTISIGEWKRKGVIHADFNILYEEYIKTFNCQHCSKTFKNTRDRCLDHDHKTGLFRKIVCQQCNVSDNYIRFPEGVPSRSEREKKYREVNKEKEIKRGKKYREENKEKEIERHKKYNEENKEKLLEKFNCPCGGKYQYISKVRHNKTKKHIAYLDLLED